MKVALINPPLCDPTMPYVALPVLAASLRDRGVEVVAIDANIEAVRRLMSAARLASLLERSHARFRALDSSASLGHAEQLEYVALAEALSRGGALPSLVEDAVAVLCGRGGERFYDARAYGQATAVLDAALKMASAAFHPLAMSFASYRGPFTLLSPDEIEAESRPERNPFHAYVEEELLPRIEAEGPGLVGLSVAFPGQVQPAYSLAHAIRRRFPALPLTAGGPAITQLLAPLSGGRLERALRPFDTAVLFEGEAALADLVGRLERGERPAGPIRGARATDLAALPCPDFDGLPLGLYLSPELVLPYDASRGCYWGRCAFCHYGLAEAGTAVYRERGPERTAAHLALLAGRHRAGVFYLSEDTAAPAMLGRMAGALSAARAPVRWATDVRGERGLDARRARDLAAGGALAVSIGLESASPRLLSLIGKGLDLATMGAAIDALAAAGIAVEVMAFTDFPTETAAEALRTIRFLRERSASIALFMCGEFALVPGSRVAADPARYGIRDLWTVRGDELGTGLFYEGGQPWKTEAQRRRADAALEAAAAGWRMTSYPWAGSLSTAHTLLWYARRGPGVFRDPAVRGAGQPQLPARPPAARYAVTSMASAAIAREREIWHTLTRVRREVSREAYGELAAGAQAARPRGFPVRPRRSTGRRRRPRSAGPSS